MIKKSMVALTTAALLFGAGGIALTANAQLFTYTGTSTAPSSTVVGATSTPSSTALDTTSSSMMSSTASTTTSSTPVLPPLTSTAGVIGEYLQIDGLVVTNVPMTGTVEPAQISAANPAYDTMTAAGTVMPANSAAVTCTQFLTDSTTTGIATTCPVPPLLGMTASSTATSTTGITYSPYTIDVNAATQVLAADRTPTTLANIAAGDTVNVYGYYDGTGIMDAEILRDVSRSASGGGGTAAVSGGGGGTVSGATTTADLQAELNQLLALVAQLESEVGMTTSTPTVATATTTASITTGTTTIAPPGLGTSIYCPMIAASGATSSVPCPPPGSPTTTASGTAAIYY